MPDKRLADIESSYNPSYEVMRPDDAYMKSINKEISEEHFKSMNKVKDRYDRMPVKAPRKSD